MGNSLRSDNPIAKLNACTLISTFSKPYSEVTSVTRTPAQKGIRKVAPLFSRFTQDSRSLPAYAGFQNRVRRERNWRKGAAPAPEGEIKLHLFRSRYSS